LARAQGNLDANRQERMIKTDFIPAIGWDWPNMPGNIMQGRPEGGGSVGTACCTANLCLGGECTKDHRRSLPCSIAKIAAKTTTHQAISQTEVAVAMLPPARTAPECGPPVTMQRLSICDQRARAAPLFSGFQSV
jgi:hypothetical protein